MKPFGCMLCMKPNSTLASIAKVGAKLTRNIVTSCAPSKCYGLSVAALSESKKEWQSTQLQKFKGGQNRGYLEQ